MPLINMACLICSKEYTGYDCPSKTRKYCSQKCNHKAKTLNAFKRICETCGSSFKMKPESYNDKFCSADCVNY